MERKFKGLLIAILSVIIVVTGQLILKYGLEQSGADFSQGVLSAFIQIFSNVYVWIALIFLMVESLSWLIAISKIPLSYAYPLLSLGYVAVSVLSWLFFYENLSSMRILGLGIIVIGVFMLSKT